MEEGLIEKQTFSLFRHSPLQRSRHHGNRLRILRPQNQRGQKRRWHRAQGQEDHPSRHRSVRHVQGRPQGTTHGLNYLLQVVATFRLAP